MQARAAITGADIRDHLPQDLHVRKNVLRIFHPHTACVTILSPALLRLPQIALTQRKRTQSRQEKVMTEPAVAYTFKCNCRPRVPQPKVGLMQQPFTNSWLSSNQLPMSFLVVHHGVR